MAPAARLSSTGVCLARPGEEYVVYTAAGGEFTVPFLTVGRYTVSIEAKGFKSQRQSGIDLSAAGGGVLVDLIGARRADDR